MIYAVTAPKVTKANIQLPISKSEKNRLLIIQFLAGFELRNVNQNESSDSQILRSILIELKSNTSEETTINAGDAGTSLRFLIALLSIQADRKFILTGSERMRERPCGPLVDSLKILGADIEYVENQGFPPLRISGKYLKGGQTELSGGISSQFVSALMLIAPVLENGLNIHVKGELISKPYVYLTASIMRQFEVDVTIGEDNIKIIPGQYKPSEFKCESDWSAASYWYSLVCLGGGTIELKGLKRNSYQGDSVLVKLFEKFGVTTEFGEHGITISRNRTMSKIDIFEYDFSRNPDLAQTMAVLCAGLGLKAHLTGLQTLIIKETDRLMALQNELSKIGVNTLVSEDEIRIEPSSSLTNGVTIETYRDHRMAMAFAPLASILKEIKISDPEVVKKSYPTFWDDLRLAGFQINSK